MEHNELNPAEPFGLERPSAEPRMRARQLTEAEKRAIVEESYSASGSVTVTAQRHGVSTSALSRWRQIYREAELDEDQASGFVPATVVADAPGVSGRMEIVSANGRRVVVGNDFDGSALARLLDVVEARP